MNTRHLSPSRRSICRSAGRDLGIPKTTGESGSAPRMLRGLYWAVLLVSLLVFPTFVQAQASSRLQRSYQEYLEKTRVLTEKFQEQRQQALNLEDAELAALLQQKLDSLQGNRAPGSSLPREIQPGIPLSLTGELRALHLIFKKTCEEAGREFYLLARRVQAESPTFAFDLLNLVLQIDSDHASARSLRGFVRQGNTWMTPFERDQRGAGKVEHPRFGWIPTSHVDRYEKGERYFLGSWMTAEKEAEIRRDFRYAWNVQTEHFNIKTNVSLEQGVILGRKLEFFHDYFKQTFALFYNSPEQLRTLFDETSGRSKTRAQLYEVHFFRTKDEYVAKLQSRIPQIAMTNGLYQLEDRVAYFYHDATANLDATLFHEATHQMMYESHPKQRGVGQQGHFWVIEGIACYMESFRIVETDMERRYDVGNPRFVRFHWARHRLLEEEYRPSLESFAKMGMVAYQTGGQQELQRRYSQASGLSHFFMHYADGKYRDAFMLHLAQLYHSNPRIQDATQGLDVLTGVPYSTLDRQYREYLQDQAAAVGDDPVFE